MEVWKFLVVSVACIHISSTHGREVSKSVYYVAYIKHLLMLLLNRNCDSDFSGSFFFFFSNDRKWTDLSWRNFTLFFELPVSWYGRPSKTSQKQYGVLTGKGFWWCFSLGLCTGSILLIQNAILDLKNTFEGRTFCCSFMFQVQMLLV